MVATLKAERTSHAALLASAHTALNHGLWIAAGVLSRVALESHLKYLCKSHRCEPEKRRATARDFLGRLYNQHHVTKAWQRALKTALKTGDNCAHNEPVTWQEIQYAISTAGEFIETNELAPWWADVFPRDFG